MWEGVRSNLIGESSIHSANTEHLAETWLRKRSQSRKRTRRKPYQICQGKGDFPGLIMVKANHCCEVHKLEEDLKMTLS